MERFIPEKKHVYKSDDAGKVYFFAIVIILALNFIFSFVAQGLVTGNDTEALEKIYSSNVFNSIFAVCSLLSLLGIFFVHKKIENFSYSASRINKKLKWHTILICIGVGIVALLGLQYLTGVFDDFLSLIKFPLDNSSTFEMNNFGQYVLAVVVLAIIPAIGEELIFRGVVFRGLNSRYSNLLAIVLSSIMFAFFHMSLQQIFYQFLLGMIMAWIVLKTDSLISSMIVHFTSNFLVVTFEFIRIKTGFSLNISHAWWFYLLAVILAVITFGILFLIDKFYFSKKTDSKIEKGESVVAPKEEKTSGYVWFSLAISVALLVVGTISKYLAV